MDLSVEYPKIHLILQVLLGHHVLVQDELIDQFTHKRATKKDVAQAKRACPPLSDFKAAPPTGPFTIERQSGAEDDAPIFPVTRIWRGLSEAGTNRFLGTYKASLDAGMPQPRKPCPRTKKSRAQHVGLWDKYARCSFATSETVQEDPAVRAAMSEWFRAIKEEIAAPVEAHLQAIDPTYYERVRRYVFCFFLLPLTKSELFLAFVCTQIAI